MRNLLSLFIVLLVVLSQGIVVAEARGGRSSDECPVGSKDPDCQ